jgi:hypothetical protein
MTVSFWVTYTIVALLWLLALLGTLSLASEATALHYAFGDAPHALESAWSSVVGVWRDATMNLADPIASGLSLPLNHAFVDLCAIAIANGVAMLFYWMGTFELHLVERRAWRVINGYAEDRDAKPPRRIYTPPERYKAILYTNVVDHEHLFRLLSVESFVRRAGMPIRLLFWALIVVVAGEVAFLTLR